MMRDIAFGESGKIKKFPKGKMGSGKQSYPCQPMFLPMAIIGHQKRHKLFKIVIGDGQAVIHIGLANGKIGLEQKDARTGGNFANESSHLVWLIHLSGSGRGHWQSRCEDNRYAKIAAV